MKRVIVVIAACACVGLVGIGGLWLVQGLGWVTIDPIACVGECRPLRGPNPEWAVVGATALAAGLVAGLAAARGILRWNRGLR